MCLSTQRREGAEIAKEFINVFLGSDVGCTMRTTKRKVISVVSISLPSVK